MTTFNVVRQYFSVCSRRQKLVSIWWGVELHDIALIFDRLQNCLLFFIRGVLNFVLFRFDAEAVEQFLLCADGEAGLVAGAGEADDVSDAFEFVCPGALDFAEVADARGHGGAREEQGRRAK